jgi:histidyl-tRNA synthetase
MTASTVQPRLSRGLRDLLPEQIAARQRIIDTVRGVYESYGFVPLATPAVEYLDVLTGSGGQEANQSIFSVTNPEKEKLGLRFDLTVPLARVISQYRDLPRPFRRYQVADVWRADKPGPGRFREFTQFDIDSVGVASDLADVEIIAVMCDALGALDVGAFKVRFSSRRVLNLLLTFAGIDPSRGADAFRVLDKLDKIGAERVRKELTSGYKDDSGDTIPGLGLKSEQVDRIEQFLAIRAESRDEVLSKLRQTIGQVPNATEEIDVLARMSKRLASLGYGDDRVSVDLSVARGLAYYTGPVFEAILTDAPQYGSVFGGGRYDDLVMRFLGERVPAVGSSMGVDRLLAALVELNRIKLKRSTAQVLVTVLDESMTEEYLAIVFELRRAGVPAELYLGDARIGKQVKLADAMDIPVVLMYGPDEKTKGVVTVKDMVVGRAKSAKLASDRSAWLQDRPGQVEAPRGELVSAVKRMLSQGGN